VQTDPPRVLIVANRTAVTPALLEAVRARARAGPARFHLVVPATPRGLHRLVDPEVAGLQEAHENLDAALPLLTEAAGQPVTGAVGDANPVCAIEDVFNADGFDELIVSTLGRRFSRWMRLDVMSKAGNLGVPVTHVEPSDADSPAPAAAGAER